ncbi:helix-turn-helix domain-containing protein [Streptomyces sp. NY05-11A]|uniref:helix-turn-helix domain-containing protein n=1 Tax=Streptomyces soliscabiei TaxID=588897 RepID=UPI0029B4EF16|nr:helix-turn-helix transcriptional regulator [Streptomyces sp. NY05-11A]MDX2675799.1 helix-turn-helix transcriptional regulator [Streptomyces sp. NY05-11A]
MEHTTEALAPVNVIRARVKELRGRSGITAAELAERLTALGVNWNRSIVANFEGGRRPGVSVVEWLALAQVLNVAPLHLLVPPDAPDDAPYLFTPQRWADVRDVRNWVRGFVAINSENPQRFFREGPREEWEYLHWSGEIPLDQPPKPPADWGKSRPAHGGEDG